MTKSDYLASEEKRIAVGSFMIECRTRAPDVYRKAFALHYALVRAQIEKEKCEKELEVLVRELPDHARVVIDALEMANSDGAHYEQVIGILHSMLARGADQRVMSMADETAENLRRWAARPDCAPELRAEIEESIHAYQMRLHARRTAATREVANDALGEIEKGEKP